MFTAGFGAVALLGTSLSYFNPVTTLLHTTAGQTTSAANFRSKPAIVRRMTLKELVEDEKVLRAGERTNPTIITILYDSSVGTHQEYLSVLGVKQIFDRVAVDQVLLVDLADQSDAERQAADQFLMGQLSIDLRKAARKTNPSIFLQANDSLHKVKPDQMRDVGKFHSFVDKVSKVKLAATIRDLVTALKLNNTKLDSLTIVYCTDGAPERRELE